MISRFGLIKRKTGLSDDAFLAHWQNVHGPLAAQLPELRAYYQHRIEDDRHFGVTYVRGSWDLDGFSELQFDNVDDMKAALNTPIFDQTVDDADLFLSSARLVVCEKHTVVPLDTGSESYVKRMSLLKRHPHLSSEDFRREWLNRHAELITEWPDVLGYNQNLVIDRYSSMSNTASYDAVPIDGIVELWFRSKDAADALFKSAQVEKTQEHGREFISEVTTYFVETKTIV